MSLMEFQTLSATREEKVDGLQTKYSESPGGRIIHPSEITRRAVIVCPRLLVGGTILIVTIWKKVRRASSLQIF